MIIIKPSIDVRTFEAFYKQENGNLIKLNGAIEFKECPVQVRHSKLCEITFANYEIDDSAFENKAGVFHNYDKDPIPADLTPGTEIYILYAPNPRSDRLILRETHLGLLPYIGGIKGWILSKDLLSLFASEILDKGIR